ncbi:MAG: hypothetical protein J6A60_07750 [Clostridia bacterium]|nr:hypothetical protein [Clostridia bacterium]
MLQSITKYITSIVLALVCLINSFGNLIGVGDIIVTEPAETTLTSQDPTYDDSEDPDSDMTRAQLAAFLNSESAKIAENGSYKLSRTSSYTDPVDVGAGTDALNKLIEGISDGDNIDTVVGGFLRIGTVTAEIPDDYADDDFLIKATALTADDIKNFKYENGIYKFTLENVSNPKKTGETSFSRFTNDFYTHEEVVAGIAEFTSAVTVEDSNVDYKDINVELTVENGKIKSLRYSYNFDAAMTLKFVVKINGTLSATTANSYSEIEY